ncbi:MAG: beta-ketoacyl-[acyl-carrier-protein] synthase family protein [Candidatus Omnitrophica bacterium]|nr:beta-ketoacyl-[acyl-carrier-protein] synthase family protein [Candidatus Omnitrophota bacterium]
MPKKRIVITGVGVVSPIGIGKEQFWQSLSEGKSNFKPIAHFDTSGLKTNIAGEITGFDPKQLLGKAGLMDWDRASLFLSSAVKLALSDAGLEISAENTCDTGVSIGTTFGSLYSISEFDKEAVRDGPRLANPSVFTSTVGNSPASRAAIKFGIKGFNSTISTGMCSSLDAIDYARDLMTLDKIKTVVSGAVEALSPQIFLGFYKLNYLSVESHPFDKRRNGIILSEGAVAYILENTEEAKKRKTHVYAEILGVGSAFDPARFYKYNPKAIGMKKAMVAALADAGLKPENIDCIFANANSTKDADLAETNAIKEVFGAFSQKIPVTSIKSTLGETYSASGGMNLVAAIGALKEGFIPAITNLDKPDPACDLNYVTKTPKKARLERIMINAFGPNGESTVLIIGRAN